MLNNDATININSIKTAANQIWGNNAEFGQIKVLDSPYPEFEWPMRLYEKVDILLAYDRSALDIGVPRNGQYVLMNEFTNKPFVRGMASTHPENILNNFRVLDEVVQGIL